MRILNKVGGLVFYLAKSKFGNVRTVVVAAGYQRRRSV